MCEMQRKRQRHVAYETNSDDSRWEVRTSWRQYEWNDRRRRTTDRRIHATAGASGNTCSQAGGWSERTSRTGSARRGDAARRAETRPDGCESAL